MSTEPVVVAPKKRTTFNPYLLKTSMPTMWRLILTIVVAAIALGFTFILNATQNGNVAHGTAIAIAVVGLTWLTGLSGQVSIGNSGFVLVGSFAAAIYDQHHQGTDIGTALVSLLIATACGAVVGLVVGIPGTRLRGPYLAGMTLAFAVVLPQFVINMSSITGGSQGLFTNGLTPPSWFASLLSADALPSTVNAQWETDFFIVIAAVAFFFMSNLFNSKPGRAMRLVRDNDVAAELAGINLPRARAQAFVVSAAYGGLCGGLLTIFNLGANTNYFPFSLSIVILTLMVLGGIGTISGALIGGLIYAFSASVINTINSWTGIDPTSNLGVNMNGIIFGLLLILGMLLAPAGAAGTFYKSVAKMKARKAEKQKSSSQAPSA